MQPSTDTLPIEPIATKRWVASANGEVARVLLSFLATAGLFYVNIMPALISGLIEGLGFSNRDAGLVGSANIYGAALGALTAVFIVKKIPWRKTSVFLLLSLIMLDGLSTQLEQPIALIITRLCHGCLGGMLVGIGFAVISRTTAADRTFGYLLTVQFGLGGLGLMYLPGLVPVYGTAPLFIALIAFSLITLAMLPFLSPYPITEQAVEHKHYRSPKNIRLIILSLLSVFLFQAANMGIYAYVIALAKHHNLEMGFISSTLGAAAWIAICGSVLVIFLSLKFGRLLPLVISILLTAVGTWAFHYSQLEWVYWLANVGVGVTWAFAISYLLGMCSEFDNSGQMAALGGFASKMGLASGPFAAALLLKEDNYELIINIATVALIIGCLIVTIPAKALDRRQQKINASN
jgi:predicted MFS family arabinose efflux permease